jgi:hypothetical protein
MGAGTDMNTIVDFLSMIFWGYVLIYGLLAVGFREELAPR